MRNALTVVYTSLVLTTLGLGGILGVDFVFTHLVHSPHPEGGASATGWTWVIYLSIGITGTIFAIVSSVVGIVKWSKFKLRDRLAAFLPILAWAWFYITLIS